MTAKVRRRIAIALVAVVAIALVLVGVRRCSRGTVEVVRVENLGMSYWGDEGTLAGIVQEGEVQDVVLRDGEVLGVNVAAGDTVSKGDVLMSYDATKFELTLLNDKAKVAGLERDVARAERELQHLQGLRPSEEAPQGTEEVIDHGALDLRSVIDKGATSQEDGSYDYTFLCTPSTRVTAAFLRSLRDSGKTAEFVIYEDDVCYGSWVVDGSQLPTTTDSYEEYEWPTVVEPDPADDGGDDAGDDGDDTGGDTGDDTGGDAGDDAGGDAGDDSGDAGDAGGSTTTPFVPDETLYTQNTSEAITDDWVIGEGLSLDADGITVTSMPDDVYGLLVSTTPEAYERYETIYHAYVSSDDNYVYSRAELAQMIKDQQAAIEEAELDLREARVTYQQDLLVNDNGEVVAAIDGTVTAVTNPADANVGDVVITVKGEARYTVTIYVDELSLDEVAAGDEFYLTAWDSGTSAYATVTEVGTVPAEGTWAWSDVNPVNSWYPLTAVVTEVMGESDDATMKVGEYVEATRLSSAEVDTQSIYLEKMYVRSDDEGSYVLVAGDDGRLERRAVTTGRVIWGSYVQITSGLEADDLLAFPYGNSAVEGASTTEVDYFSE